MEDEILTIDEVAALLKIKPATVYLWVKDNKLPYHRIGTNTLRFSRKEILDFIKSK